MKKNKNITEKIVNEFKTDTDTDILSDVNGSYTGVPIDCEEPVQDADDL